MMRSTSTSTSIRVMRATRASRLGLPLAAAATAALLSLPFWGDAGLMRTATEILYFLALAQLWNVLAGYAGLASFGQQAYVGLGGYTLAAAVTQLGLDPFLSVPLAGLVCAAIAWPVSRLMFRLQGAYFAVGTWVVAEVCRLLLTNTGWLGAGSGMSLTSAMQEIDGWWREALTLWLAVLLGIGSLAGVFLLLRSRVGLGLTALRDSEAAAESLGVRVPRLKLWVYLLAALGCGLVGALIFLTKLRISPDAAFSANWTITVVFIVVIGGIGTIEGPLVGTLVYFVLRAMLADYGSIHLIVFGALAIVVMLFLREGLWGFFAARFGLQLFPVRRHAVPVDTSAPTTGVRRVDGRRAAAGDPVA